MATITARVAVDGELEPTDELVFDFLELKRIMRRLCGEIDHLVLLPLESPRILEAARWRRADRNIGQVRAQCHVTSPAGLMGGLTLTVGPSFAAFHVH